MIYKALAIATLIATSMSAAIAQTRTIEHEYSEFDSIVASNDFKVNLVVSDTYATKVVVDDALESYVQCYVKAKTLYIALDEKNIPKDVKKSYKGKNVSDPVLTAVVYMPSIKALTLSDGASFTTTSTIENTDFTLSMTDNCSITNMSVTVNKTAEINLSKKSKIASLYLRADEAVINADGSATLTSEVNAQKVKIANSGSAELTINGESEDASVSLSGGSKLLMTGKADSFKVSGKGSSAKVDAAGLQVKDAVMVFSGATVSIDPSKSLELDLGKGADLTYSDNPEIKIVKIQSASVTRK